MRPRSPSHRRAGARGSRPLRGRAVALLVCLAASEACDRERDSAATAAPAASTTTQAAAPQQSLAQPQPQPQPPSAAEVAIAAGDVMPALAATATPPQAKASLWIVTSLEAAQQGETLQDLDAIARLYADNGLHAAIVLASFDGSKARPPTAFDEQAVRALVQRRRLATPVVPGSGDAPWSPAIVAAPTVVLARPDGRVHWVGAAESSWAALDRAIVELLGG
ncbi:MAG: hypothetical protein U0168_26340 [Nannocystaceae bacterium]